MRTYTKTLIAALKENNIPIPTVGSTLLATRQEQSKSISEDKTQIPNKITISVSCLGVSLNSMVNTAWTVAETISRISHKFPETANNFCLFIKNGKASYTKLEEDKQLFIYKQLLQQQDPKSPKVIIPWNRITLIHLFFKK